MKVVIAGGTGFLGRPLADALVRDGYDIVILTRAPGARVARGARAVMWNANSAQGPWTSEIDAAGAVVNLAGEPIGARRWTGEQKQRILDSRVNATRTLATAIRAAATPPPVFVSGSAVGYYGALGDEPATEERGAGTGFLAAVAERWEQEAMLAASERTRVVCVRTGIVLAPDGGALAQMLPLFRVGAGGPFGSGRQYLPWIHRDDWVALVRWAIATASVSGPLNATAPHPVTSTAFARATGRAMHRPAVLRAPAFALRLLLGEMADGMLVSGQNAIPAKAIGAGFRFRYDNVDQALAAIFSRA
jgi:uncharacterized protein (TIGR01777 family)